MSRNGIIYLVTCPNGLSYVGKTVQKLGDRIGQHKGATASTRALRDAFCKHGDSMKVSVLMRCREEDLDTNESLYIEILDTVHPRGYNLRCGKMAARPRTEQALSTHVHSPVQYDSKEDRRSVSEAVEDDIRKICRNAEVKPWAGVVKKSVEEVNRIRGARQFAGWAGPRKGTTNEDYERNNHLRKQREQELAYQDRKYKREEEEDEAKIKEARQERDKKRKRSDKEHRLKSLLGTVSDLKKMGFDEEAGTILKEYMAARLEK